MMKGFYCFIALSNAMNLPHDESKLRTPPENNLADFETPPRINGNDNMNLSPPPLRPQRLRLALSNAMNLPHDESKLRTPPENNLADFETPPRINGNDNMNLSPPPLRPQRLDFNDNIAEEVTDDAIEWPLFDQEDITAWPNHNNLNEPDGFFPAENNDNIDSANFGSPPRIKFIGRLPPSSFNLVTEKDTTNETLDAAQVLMLLKEPRPLRAQAPEFHPKLFNPIVISPLDPELDGTEFGYDEEVARINLDARRWLGGMARNGY
jgi:hypothetical protein